MEAVSSGPSFAIPTLLPSSLIGQYENEAKLGITQSSWLVAWSWSDLTFYQKEPARGYEKALKVLYIKLLTDQGRHTGAYSAYDVGGYDPENIEPTMLLMCSYNIRYLFLGAYALIQLPEDSSKEEKAALAKLQEPENTVNFNGIMQGVYKQDFTFAKSWLADMFAYLVDFSSYTGRVLQNKADSGLFPQQYTLVLGYPPKPVTNFGSILTQETIDAWVNHHQPLKPGEYLLPPAYIPFACSS